MISEIKAGDNVMIIGGYGPLRGVVGVVEDILEDDQLIQYKVIVSGYPFYFERSDLVKTTPVFTLDITDYNAIVKFLQNIQAGHISCRKGARYILNAVGESSEVSSSL